MGRKPQVPQQLTQERSQASMPPIRTMTTCTVTTTARTRTPPFRKLSSCQKYLISQMLLARLKNQPRKQRKKTQKPAAEDVNIDEDFMNDVMNDLGIDLDEDDAAKKDKESKDKEEKK